MCNPRPLTIINTTYLTARNNFVTKEQASQKTLFFLTKHIIVKHNLATFRRLQKVEGTLVELILIFGIGEILSCIFFVTKFYVQPRCSVC